MVVNTFYGARYRAITSEYGFLAVHAGHIPGRLVGFRGVRDLEKVKGGLVEVSRDLEDG